MPAAFRWRVEGSTRNRLDRVHSRREQVAALRPRDVAGDRQSKSGSAGLGGEKRLKNPAEHGLWNRLACVLHVDADFLISVVTAQQ